MALRRGARVLCSRVRAHRLHRRAQLVPQHRPQLGTDGLGLGSTRRAARPLPHRRARPCAPLHARRGHAGMGRRSSRRDRRRRRRALGAAAVARRRQRRTARLLRGPLATRAYAFATTSPTVTLFSVTPWFWPTFPWI